MTAPVEEIVPELGATCFAGATVQDLLDMRAGVRFREDYDDPGAEITERDRVYQWRPGLPAAADAIEYFGTLGSDGPHGGPFRYRSILTDVLAWVIERAGRGRFADLVSKELWQPMGAEFDAEVTVNRNGNALELLVGPRAGRSAVLRRWHQRAARVRARPGRAGGGEAVQLAVRAQQRTAPAHDRLCQGHRPFFVITTEGLSVPRSRRSNLAVPGSSLKMIDKARTLPVDQLFLDLEDACAPLAKPRARENIVAALNEGGFDGKVRVVRVNDWTTPWTYRDVVDVVEGAGANLDCIMLPKVVSAEQVVALDLLLTQIETTMGYQAGRIGIEVQIENPPGLIAVDAIAKASPRVETIIFGPADFMASINMKSLVVGEQPPGYDVGDAYHHILMSILIAARANGKQAIDGPYLAIRDVDGFRRSAGRSSALGFDGKWVLHPDQIAAANEAYSPRQEDYDHAELILDAYDHYTSAEGGAKGAAMLGDEMIDEASRKMALVIAAKGRAAGLSRTQSFTP